MWESEDLDTPALSRFQDGVFPAQALGLLIDPACVDILPFVDEGENVNLRFCDISCSQKDQTNVWDM